MNKDLEIIRNIAQAARNIVYDGATDENYEAHEIGLKRDEGNPIIDSRIVDGFKVRMAGNRLIITYNVEQKLSDVYALKLEQEMLAIIQKCANYLKSEYRKVAGKNLKLTLIGDVDVMVQYISRVRTSVCAQCVYEIGSLSNEVVEEVSTAMTDSEERLRDTFKKFLSMGRDDAVNPMNITRKDT